MNFITLSKILCISIFFVGISGTAYAQEESSGNFFERVAKSELTDASYTITNTLPPGVQYEQAAESIATGIQSESTKKTISFKQKTFGTMAPFVDGLLDNALVTIPATHRTYPDEDGFYFTYDPNDELFYFLVAEDYDEEFSIDEKGNFLIEDEPITSRSLKSEGFKNIQIKKGIFNGMRGYHATAISADVSEDETLRVLLVYVPETESILTVNLYDENNYTEAKRVWNTFVQSVFSKVKKTNQRDTGASLVEPVPYTNSLYEISLPKGWVTCECESDYELWLFDTVSHNFKKESITSSISISGDLTGETEDDLNEYIVAAKGAYKDIINGWKFQSGKKITVNKVPAVLINGTYKTELGTILSVYQLIVIKDSITYFLTAEAPKTKWGDYEKTLHESLLSFSIK